MAGYDITVLDEVHYYKGAGPKLKYLVDNGKKIWITSSSEVILGKEILSFLVGRISVLRLFSFSLSEFLRARGQKELTPAILERSVWEHQVFGGYPRVALAEDPEMKKTILRDLYQTMILKDIAQTFSVNNIRSLEDFSKYLAVNTGSIVSYKNLSSELQLSFQTVKKYLNAMEKSYLVTRIQPFYSNKAKEITKQPKVYFVDTGLRNSITKTFPENPDGRIFENYVLTELIKAGFQPRYWRTKSKAEVDFVIEKNSEVIPIEVKINAKPRKIKRSLRSFIKEYKPQTALVVTMKGRLTKTKIGNCNLLFTNVKEMTRILTLPQ